MQLTPFSSPTLSSSNSEPTIVFEDLPYPVQLRIYEKFSFNERVNFESCSKFSREFCEKRPSVSHPFELEKMAIEGGLLFKQVDERNKLLLPLTDCPSVKFQTKMLFVLDTLTDDLFNFIANRFGSVETLIVTKINRIPHFYYELIKKLNVKKHLIDADEVKGDCPRDFADLEEVDITSAHCLSPNQIFGIKSKQLSRIWGSSISYTDLLVQIEAWTEGKQWHSPTITFKKLQNFDLGYFIAAMNRKFPVLQINFHGYSVEWIVKRSVGQFKELKVNIGIMSVTFSQS